VNRVAFQNECTKTKRNDVIKMRYCDFYTTMTYAQFVEFEKQNDANAKHEIASSNSYFNETCEQ